MTDVSTTLLFDSLRLWQDEERRTGEMNMAIDQLLLEEVGDVPILRVYEWSEPSVSFGYFTELEAAKKSFPDNGLHYIRRWTGGGIVDHRNDTTYTLVIPRSHLLSQARGATSYRLIHQCLAKALTSLGENIQLFPETNLQTQSGDTCFTNPVPYDLANTGGLKIAGAGQKRTRQGLLHQGSVNLALDKANFLKSLAKELTKTTCKIELSREFFDQAKDLADSKYSLTAWLEKR